MIIDKGIPIPERQQTPGRWKTFAARMDPNDSVLCLSMRERDSLIKALRLVGSKCTTRKVDGGFRVWRIE